MPGPDLQPVKGMVILKFFGDEDDDDTNGGQYGTAPDDYYERTCLAQVVAVGAGVGVKRGQVVLVREYARNATKVDDDTVITDSYVILAVVTAA